MTEITGGLIRMNAHMIVREDARAMITFGIIFAVVCTFFAIATGVSRTQRHKRRYVAIFTAFVVVGVVITIIGANQPREKIIMACADGPVSLEQVATLYDIKDVDGKMLTLVER